MKWCSYHFIGSYTNEVQLSQRLSVWQTQTQPKIRQEVFQWLLIHIMKSIRLQASSVTHSVSQGALIIYPQRIPTTTASKTKSWCTRQMCCHVGVHCVWRAFVQFTASAFNDWHLQLEIGCSWVGAGLNFPQKCLTQSSKKKLNHPQSGPCLTNKHIIISIVITIIPWCNVCRTFILELDHSWVMPLYSGGKTLYQRWARSGKEEIRPRGTLFIQVPKKCCGHPVKSCGLQIQFLAAHLRNIQTGFGNCKSLFPKRQWF